LWEKRTGGALAVLEAEKHHHKMFMFLLFDWKLADKNVFSMKMLKELKF
jgi:hypothetical protein